jgi:agmatinase
MKLLEQDAKVLSLGGDHSITFPVIQAYSGYYQDLNILHFDAHPDLYPEFEGNPYSHACPFSRILESGLVKRVVQIGIRAVTEKQRSQAKKFGVEQIGINTRPEDMVLEFDGPVYVSLDLDGIDPAFAPGVSHPEPGGLSVRDVLNILHSIKNPIVGADIVEYNPVRDTFNLTATVAVKLLKEIAGIMVNG